MQVQESSDSLLPSQSAYSAFQGLFQTLCLQEFPCGMGPWRETAPLPAKLKGRPPVVKDLHPVDSKFSVTLKDYTVQTEKIDQLEEYVKSRRSLWHLDYSWSGEARELREMAVKSPWLVDGKFVHSFFKTLKIVDKNVTEVDRGLLRFKNLEELTLSANYLTSVESENLPQTMKVLELCGNRIDDLANLCHQSPPLQHLGLGYNRLLSTDDYMKGELWPQLLSLDLSHNHLTDLFDLVSKLVTLPKLRNLILQGNPMFLIPGYRGYVIDSLRLLQILDDVRVTADEKHQFKGLAKRRDYILEEVKVKLEVDFIKGLPVPEEVKNPGEQPEFPIVTRKYYVEFMFPRGAPTHADLIDGDETASLMTSRTADQTLASQSAMDNPDDADTELARTELSQSQGTLPSVATAPDSELQDEGLPLTPVRSADMPYGEELEVNWSQVFKRDNLTLVRDFLKEGMELRVMEEKVLSYPADQMKQSPDGKKDKKKEKGKKPEEKKDDKKKKKKELDIELHHMPAEYTTLATFHAPLADFLEGETLFEEVYSQAEPEVKPVDEGAKTDGKGKKKDKKNKPASAKKDEHPKSPKGDKKDSKAGKDKGGKADKAVTEEEENLPPPPLEISVRVKLIRWQTAADSVKSEQTENVPSEKGQ